MNISHKAQVISGLCAIALAACASSGSAVRVDKAEDKAVDCERFAWLSQTNEPASFADQRVRSATLAELQNKGYALSPENPDCRIAYLLSTHEIPKAKPRVGVGAGGGSGGVGGGIGVSLPIGRRDQQAGTFTIDIVDVSTNSQVWSGSLDVGFASAEPTEDELKDAVRKVLAEFPDRQK